MRLYKIISIMIFFCVASLCMNRLLAMERRTQREIVSFFSYEFNLSSPSKLLQSIKNLQRWAKPDEITKALKLCLQISSKKNLNQLTERIDDGIKFSTSYHHANILYFLDETCDKNTVSIILSSFNTEEQACEFILSCDGFPSGLEYMLRKNYQKCALPMIALLWKNKIKIHLARHRFLIGLELETIDIDTMVTQTRKKLETPSSFFCCKKFIPDQEITDEMVLLAVIKELKKLLNTDLSAPEKWLGYFKFKPQDF